jgi:TetR/AcrR family transcriptional regulator
MSWQRATQPLQKEHRKLSIQKAAAALLEEQSYEQISLNAIAQRADLSKSNLYRYFEGKEDIFLHLLEDDLQIWMGDLQQSLTPWLGTGNVPEIAQAMALCLVKHPRLCRLISLLPAVLEQNLSEKRIIAYKQEASTILLRLVHTILATMPQLSPQQASRFPLYLHATVAGLWPLANPSQSMSNVLQTPEYEAFKTRVPEDLAAMLQILLDGMLVASVREPEQALCSEDDPSTSLQRPSDDC